MTDESVITALACAMHDELHTSMVNTINNGDDFKFSYALPAKGGLLEFDVTNPDEFSEQHDSIMLFCKMSVAGWVDTLTKNGFKIVRIT